MGTAIFGTFGISFPSDSSIINSGLLQSISQHLFLWYSLRTLEGDSMCRNRVLTLLTDTWVQCVKTLQHYLHLQEPRKPRDIGIVSWV